MIPRLNLLQNSRNKNSSWPTGQGDAATPLFVDRSPFRKLVVLIDSDILNLADAHVRNKEQVLAELITLDPIDALSYADNGPPANAPRRPHWNKGEDIVGWAILSPENKSGHRWARWALENSSGDSIVTGNAPDIAAKDETTDAYSDLDPVVAAERRREDVLAAQVAGAVGADIFITDRPYLHKANHAFVKEVTCCHVGDALAFIGLYLRSQGLFIAYCDSTGVMVDRFHRGLYYWVGARELLPAGWRWFSACVQHSTSNGNDSLLHLGGSALKRVERALQIRDEVHVELNKPQYGGPDDQAILALDNTLLLLMGAVDATAGVAHVVLNISTNARSAGWQNKSWLDKVSAAAPSLGALFQNDTEGFHTLTVLRLLRNSIHSEAMQAVGVGTQAQNRQLDRIVVKLPSSQQKDLLTSMVALDSEEAWGIEHWDRAHADPGILLERLFPRVIRMLDKTMEETPVEQLPGINQPLKNAPPVDKLSKLGVDPFSEVSRKNIRLQLGL